MADKDGTARHRTPRHAEEGQSKALDYQAITSPEIPSSSSSANQESHLRSFVKGLTWRILATSTTTIIAYVVTGKIDSALQIGFFEFFAKLAIYYVHERIWTKISL